jgi:hypothetical protein
VPSCIQLGMSEFFPIPILYDGKNPLLVDGKEPGLSHAKNAVGGSKNIPLTAERIIRCMKGHIPQECRNFFLFLQCSWDKILGKKTTTNLSHPCKMPVVGV